MIFFVKRIFRPLLIVLLFLLQQQQAHATEQPVIRVLNGSKNQLQKDSFVVVKDQNYFGADNSFNSSILSAIDTPYAVKNIVSLRLNELSNLFLRDSFTVTVQVRIVYYTNSFSTPDSITRSFTINYDSTKSYQSISSFVFSGAHMVKVQVLDVSSSVSWDVLPAVMLTNEMIIDPAYKFACTNQTINHINYSTDSLATQGELHVIWDAVNAADQYDLEWTYIDSSALGKYGNPYNESLIFSNNATRVTITANNYMIPLLYDDKGTLFFRVRPVQLKDKDAVL
ncbi:MAG: hypothetical protein HY305_05650, partial [Sphingobacteriales bacterium]|nr:hypothetical protein [Sphingobacteriales bacterium]